MEDWAEQWVKNSVLKTPGLDARDQDVNLNFFVRVHTNKVKCQKAG